MDISYQWLQQFVGISQPAEEIARLLTSTGLEVEAVGRYEQVKGGLEGLVVGQVLTCAKHPNADKLSVTTVEVGNGTVLPIVCGAPNVAAGQKVIVALPGATLYPASGEPFVIKKSKIRGEVSEGMICAEDEIGLGHSHEGIMVLATDLPNGTPAAQYFNLATDQVFTIGLTPNRADAASHWGVARDLKAKLGLPLCMPTVEHFKVENTSLAVQVEVENAEACPRYAGVSIAGVRVGESPMWLKHRLQAIGLSPINNIVDITNYVLHELGQPLHAFDLDKIAGRTVRVKTLPEGTPFTTLDKVERKLKAKDLMICDGDSQPMCMAGVFGGASSGITEATQNVFLESAYFSPAYIRASSQQHALKTDASFRFERGINPHTTVYALKRAALLIQEIAGGHIASEVVDVYPTPIENRLIKAKYKNIDRLIGKRIDRAEITRILQALDIEVLAESEDALELSVPPYRVDAEQEADVVEEIIRIYGYDNIEIGEHLGADFIANFPEPDEWKSKVDMAKHLAANGFHEIMTNSLTKPDYAAALALSAEADVEITNKLSSELGVMRQTVLFSGLEVIAHNINRKQKELRLFEFGKTYQKQRKDDGSYQFRESEKLVLFITGSQHAESWRHKTEKADFYDLAAAVQKLLQKMGIGGYQQTESTHPALTYGLALVLNKREIAHLGLVKPAHTKMLDIKQEVWYAELDWQYLLAKRPVRLSYKELSKFPEVRRDLSLVIDRQVGYEEIKKLAFGVEKNLLQDINVFDVYEGDNLGANKKAYAISFTLQDAAKTLTDDTIDKTMQRLIDAFEKQLGALIRR